MINSIDVSVEFDFKGEAYSPSLTVDLDQFVESNGSFESIYLVLAKTNGIDTYSYLYEVMQASELCYQNPQGMAENYLQDGRFDFEAFQVGWYESNILEDLQSIATQELGVASLEENLPLKNALLQAYRLGCKSRVSIEK